MKTAEELKELETEVEALSRKLHELTEEELEQVSGGFLPILIKFPTGKKDSSTLFGRGKNGNPVLQDGSKKGTL